MSSQLRGAEGSQNQSPAQGIGQALKGSLSNGISSSTSNNTERKVERKEKEKLALVNRAGESKSPYVRAHKENPVKWQTWGEEAISLAKRENRLLFVSIGYSACHCKSPFRR